MPYNLEQLNALENALANGERRVSFGDKTVEYRSIDELMQAIREIKRGLRKQGQLAPAARQVRVITSKAT